MSLIDWKIHTYAALPSTQIYGVELAEEGLPEGTVIQSLTQSKGKGRQGRVWRSPMGNLYMSWLLRPDCSVAEAGQISFLTGLAVLEAIREFNPKTKDMILKWPNDILIEGKKAAGIILDNISEKGKATALVVGVGVNIMAAPEEENAIALKDVCDKPVAIHPFRDVVLKAFDTLYGQWQEEGFAPIRKAWLKNSYKPGEILQAKLPKENITGRFKGLSKDGALILERDDSGEEMVIHTGEIMLAEAS